MIVNPPFQYPTQKRASAVGQLQKRIVQILPEWRYKINTVTPDEIVEAALRDREIEALTTAHNINIRQIAANCLHVHRKSIEEYPKFENVEVNAKFQTYFEKLLSNHISEIDDIGIEDFMAEAKQDPEFSDLMTHYAGSFREIVDTGLSEAQEKFKEISQQIKKIIKEFQFEEEIPAAIQFGRKNFKEKGDLIQIREIIEGLYKIAEWKNNPKLKCKTKLQSLRFLMGDSCEFDSVLNILKVPRLLWLKERILEMFQKTFVDLREKLNEEKEYILELIPVDDHNHKLRFQSSYDLHIEDDSDIVATLKIQMALIASFSNAFKDIVYRRSVSINDIKVSSKGLKNPKLDRLLRDIQQDIRDPGFHNRMNGFLTRFEKLSSILSEEKDLKTKPSVKQVLSRSPNDSSNRSHSSQFARKRFVPGKKWVKPIKSMSNLKSHGTKSKVTPRRRLDEEALREDVQKELPAYLRELAYSWKDPEELRKKIRNGFNRYNDSFEENMIKLIIDDEILQASDVYHEDCKYLIHLETVKTPRKRDGGLEHLGNLPIDGFANDSDLLIKLFSQKLNRELLKLSKNSHQVTKNELFYLQTLFTKIYRAGWSDHTPKYDWSTSEELAEVAELRAREILCQMSHPIQKIVPACLTDSTWAATQAAALFPSIPFSKQQFKEKCELEKRTIDFPLKIELLSDKTELRIDNVKLIKNPPILPIRHCYVFRLFNPEMEDSPEALIHISDCKEGEIREGKKFKRDWFRYLEVTKIEFPRKTPSWFFRPILRSMYSDQEEEN